MSVSFLPRFIFENLQSISEEFLREHDISLLMLDFDNTIVPYTTNIPTQEMDQWLKRMLNSGIHVCVVSNSRKGRVVEFCEQYGLDCITHAKKPFQRGIRACLQRYQIPLRQAALVGDQIYTDVLGANGAGITSILIPAIHNHNFWLKLRHVAEIPFIFAARKRRILNEKC